MQSGEVVLVLIMPLSLLDDTGMAAKVISLDISSTDLLHDLHTLQLDQKIERKSICLQMLIFSVNKCWNIL